MRKETTTGVEPEHGFTAAHLETLLAERSGPCVSIYLPTHLRKTEARSDAILYRNLCREVEKILARDESQAVTRDIVSRLEVLDDPEFWEHGSRGLAVFAAPDFFVCHRLPVEVPQLEVVGGTFHTKPVLRFLQEEMSYVVIALSLHGVGLYSGVGDSLTPMPASGLPQGLEDTVGERETGEARRGKMAAASNEDEHRLRVEKYIREVARVLSRRFVNDGRPLVLAAQSHHAPIFRRTCQLRQLLDDAIVGDPSKLDEASIKSEARRILVPRVEARREQAREELGLAVSRGQGSHDLRQVARAVCEGRVQRLFVQSGRRVWGLLDKGTGDLVPGDVHKNAYDVDILDELAEQTIARGGDVLVLGAQEMPSDTGVAATFRY